MLQRYAERRLGSGPALHERNGSGGVKETVFEVKGGGAYSVFKWEGGTHRVQRVPATERQGRIHTSAATVAVMPEAEDVEVTSTRGPEDGRLPLDRAGGQYVKTNDTAVRITHKPTGIVVSMQDEKSQLQNKQKAMRMFRARLYEAGRQRAGRARDIRRPQAQVAAGDRSEKIRTYNFVRTG